MNTLRLIRYGLLGVPLAFVGLPLYVHIPQFYAGTQYIDLGRLGIVLLALRLLDAFMDPLIGMVSDHLRAYRRTIMALCLPVLAGSYFLLFTPPDLAPTAMLLWLIVCLTFVYLAFSTLIINYYALGVDIASNYDENTRVAMWREGSMLVGVLFASLLPTILSAYFSVVEAYKLFAMALTPLLFVCAWATFSIIPSSPTATVVHNMADLIPRLIRRIEVRWALTIALFNAIPTAITSTLFLFFTNDVLHASAHSGPMLAAYFLSAACAMPLWNIISKKYNKRTGLLTAMFMSIFCFIWAWGLGTGDIKAFYLICVLSGMTLGADAALLPSLFADTLTGIRDAGSTAFGLWNVTSKLTMALAAGIALPLLEQGGYRPGIPNGPHALHALSFCYALLPCMLKVIAIGLLYISPLDRIIRRGAHA